MSQVIDNYLAVKEDVAKACAACNRCVSEVQLLVVSKTIPVPVLMELYNAGIREFAENREPELAMKKASMPEDIIWHFIGPVQSNKIRKVIKLAQVIHSVESLSQLERFERIAGEEGVAPRILLEVNVSGEESKGGMTPEEIVKTALKEFEVEVLYTQDIEYKCNCSKERVSKALISLGKEELTQMVEEKGDTEISCHFCDQVYKFTPNELKKLI